MTFSYKLKHCDLTFCDNMLINLNSNLDIIKYLIHNINLDSKAHFQTILDSINNNNSRDITLYLIQTYNSLCINKYTKRTILRDMNQTSDIKCELYNEYNAKVHEFLFENFKFSQEEFTKILESKNPIKYLNYEAFIKNGIVLNNKLKTKILSNALIMEDISVIKYLINKQSLFDMITRDELIEECKKQWYTSSRTREVDINSDCENESDTGLNCNCFKCSSPLSK